MADSFAFFLLALAAFAVLAAAVFFGRGSKEGREEAIRDLERRITDLMISQLKDIRESQEGTAKAMNSQIYSFAKETALMRRELKQVQESVKDVSSFQRIFKSPKLRGQWGEASLEHILAQHFPPELYEIQRLFPSGEQVDAVLLLPNKKILPIDAKFPSDNFIRMAEAESKEERDAYLKKFVADVKLRINEVSSKYILPSEGTIDYALMYIPAEAVYYEIINNLSRKTDLADYAWSKKVILASPNTIYLTLRTIEHWFKDTQISRRTQEILKRLDRIYRDAGKLADSFRKLGVHLRNSLSSYESSEKRLSLFSDRVEKLMEAKKIKKLAEEKSQEGPDSGSRA